MEADNPIYIESEEGDGDIFYLLSKLIADRELHNVEYPDLFSCKFIFKWINNVPTIEISECSEKNLSIKLQKRINERLSVLNNSNLDKFRDQSTDNFLLEKVKHEKGIDELVKRYSDKMQDIKLSISILNAPIVPSQECEIELQNILMTITNNKIPFETASRVLALLEKELNLK